MKKSKLVIACLLVLIGVALIAMGSLKGTQTSTVVGVAEPQDTPNDIFKETAAAKETAVPEPVKREASDSPSTEPEAVASPPPSGTLVLPTIKHWNTTGASVLKVNGNSIEAINTGTRTKLGMLTKGFKFLISSPNQGKHPVTATTKKVWIDVGARFYLKGSTQWFIRRYPNSSQFDAYLFEILDLEAGYSSARRHFKSFTYKKKAAWIHDDGVTIRGVKMGVVAEGKKVAGDTRKEWKMDSIDLGAFIKKTFTPEDFVVMKFDIEGGEWTVLPHLIASGAMDLVDEMFFECHPQHSVAFGNSIPQECIDFTNWLRELGVHCHRWT